MQIHVQSGDPLRESVDLAVLPMFEGEAPPVEVAGLLEDGDFGGRARQSLLLYPRGALGPRRLLLLGLGKREAYSADGLRHAAALAAQRARELKLAALSLALPPAAELDPAAAGQAAAEGLLLGLYRYTRYKAAESADPERATLLAADPAAVAAGVAAGAAVARGVALARDLANGPGNLITPAALGEQALALGQRLGLRVSVLDRAALQEQGFGGILAVGQGSANEPRFIIMEHGQAGQGPTLCFVGKGITFDTGGISIKPAANMEDMKFDMSGAAAVFGALQAIAELGLPLHVVGLVCAAENMPSSTSYRPGDIVTTLSGKTVEVLNTDAEGRIVLADGLHYAQRYSPAATVDLATLTGAITIALGPHATGLFATDQALADRIVAAGAASAERVWQLPVWDEHREAMKSEVADLKNTGGRPAGSSTAAAFLAAFVGEMPWAHLDIAGTAWAAKGARAYQGVGATGVGVRLLVELARGYLR